MCKREKQKNKKHQKNFFLKEYGKNYMRENWTEHKKNKCEKSVSQMKKHREQTWKDIWSH